MKAELKDIHSPDIYDLEKFIPKEPDNFGFLAQLLIGELGKEGEEAFNTLVCTPKWLLNKHESHDILFGYNHIIVFKYDFPKIKNKLESYVNAIEGKTWDEIAIKLQRISDWEFENYKE